MRALLAILLLLPCLGLCSPGDLPGVLRQAQELAEKGRADEAYRILQRFREENPGVKNWGLSLLMGNLAWQRGRREEAIGHWRDASALAPGETAPLQNLGKALFEMGRFEEAARAFLRAWELSGDRGFRLYAALALLRAGRAEEALGHLEALRGEGRGGRELLEALLHAYLDTGRLGEAEGVLRELLEAEPGRADYWRLLAFLRQRQGDELGAASALRVALSLKEDPSLRGELIGLYRSLGLWLPAARLLEESPGEKDYGLLCDLYLLGGKPEEALRWAREALSRVGGEEWLRRVAEVEVSLGLYEEAYDLLRERVRGHDDPYLWYLLGQCALRTGRWGEAKGAFERALRDRRYAKEARAALEFLRAVEQ